MKIVQVSDCHLFEDINGLHYGANVYKNLSDVVQHVVNKEQPDYIIFTGDLTQDHSEWSYQQFVNVMSRYNSHIPVLYVAGNHDDYALMSQYLVGHNFSDSKVIENDVWQILLIDSKSEIPSGFITNDTIVWLNKVINPNKRQLLFMHHHAIDVGYFIDNHGLINKDEFWMFIDSTLSIKALACGHVHQALDLLPENTGYSTPLYTCPATSIQFDVSKETSACNGEGPGYRVFELKNHELTTESYFINNSI